MIVYLAKHTNEEELKKAQTEFGDYIKVTVDIDKKVAVIGGQLHSDGEKVLLEEGSKQENIWGGGFDVKSGRVDTQAVINIRPSQNNDSMEILSSDIRKKFIKIAENFLK